VVKRAGLRAKTARFGTATIAATPIAMPSADSPARSLRVRNPAAATPARSVGRSRAGAGASGWLAARR
jgi:hypothetical protein